MTNFLKIIFFYFLLKIWMINQWLCLWSSMSCSHTLDIIHLRIWFVNILSQLLGCLHSVNCFLWKKILFDLVVFFHFLCLPKLSVDSQIRLETNIMNIFAPTFFLERFYSFKYFTYIFNLSWIDYYIRYCRINACNSQVWSGRSQVSEI